MEITLEKQAANLGKLRISLKSSDYVPAYQQKIKEYSKVARVNGFRPGKVPATLVTKMYGKGILLEEINRIVADNLNGYLRDNQIHIVGEPLPQPDDANTLELGVERDYDFTYKIGMVPPFELPVPSGIVRHKVQVSDADAEKAIEELRKSYPKMEDAEKSSTDSILYGTLEQGEFRKEEVVIPVARVKAEDKVLFSGLSIGSQITVDIDGVFEDHHYAHTLTGLDGEVLHAMPKDFSFTVTKVVESKPADLNQEFFDRVFGEGEVTDEGSLKSRVLSNLSVNLQRQSDLVFQEAVRDFLIEKTQVDLPAEFIKEWLLATREVNAEELEKGMQDVLGDFRWSLIRSHLQEKFPFEVTGEEVKSRVMDMYRSQFGFGASDPRFDGILDGIADNYLKQENGKNFREIYQQLVFEKSYLAYVDTLTPEEKAITPDQLKDLQKK